MARPSVIPDIKARLEAYLNDLESAYQRQPETTRNPTLPSTPDGKINVRALAQAIGLKQTQEKYLYEREELTSLVNMVAEGQDLLPIGARLVQEAGDKTIKTRMIQMSKQATESAQAAMEAHAAQAELLEQLQAVSSELETTKAENNRMRAQMDALLQGLWVEVVH